jgi:uncharacterized protein
MFWNVRGSDVFLLGSVHVANRPLALSPRLLAALDAAEIFGFEANFDLAVDRALTHLRPNDRLSERIPADLFAEARDSWIAHGFPEADLEHLRPATVGFQISNHDKAANGYTNSLGIDQPLLVRARREKRTMYFLESKNDGYAPFANAPPDEAEFFLGKTIREPDSGLQDTAKLVDAWENDDIDTIGQIGARALADMPVSFTAAIAGRNKKWLSRLVRLVKSKKRAVVIVGALHMTGHDNLPELLKRAGHECIWLGNKS